MKINSMTNKIYYNIVIKNGCQNLKPPSKKDAQEPSWILTDYSLRLRLISLLCE
jgi:hypothetical protein